MILSEMRSVFVSKSCFRLNNILQIVQKTIPIKKHNNIRLASIYILYYLE